MFAGCVKISTLNHPSKTEYSAHSIICGVVSRVQVTMDMDPISVMNFVFQLFCLFSFWPDRELAVPGYRGQND